MKKRTNILWRYLANINPGHFEIHDLENEQSECQIDEIIAAGHDRPLIGINHEYELANWLQQHPDYDGCKHCLLKFHRK